MTDMECYEKSLATLELPAVLAVLAEEAVCAALKDYYEKQGLELPKKLRHMQHHDCEACGL